MNTSIKHLAAAALASALALAAAGAQAQAGTNSLAGWTVTGDAVSVAGAITLTTAYLDGFTDQPLNLSGVSAADIAVVETAAGLAPRALDLPEPDFGTEGSLVRQSFAVAAGDTLSFTWSFASLEDLFKDHAFVVLNGQVITLATAPGPASSTFDFTFASGGTATLALGVIDTGDVLGVSSLTVSGLTVTAVPEPATLALWLAGLGAVGAAARRRRVHLEA